LRAVVGHEDGADEVAGDDRHDGPEQFQPEDDRQQRCDHGEELPVLGEPERARMSGAAAPLGRRDEVDRMPFDQVPAGLLGGGHYGFPPRE
jgi:hypothetical protein